MATRRQLFLLGGGLTAWVASFRLLPDLLSGSRTLEFEPFERVEGFRTISGGNASSAGTGAGFLVGLDANEPPPGAVMQAVIARPADALFFAGSGSAHAVPVAYFFDYYCPYCRVLSNHLSDFAGSEIVLSRHHWPIFGDASEFAARASLAAKQQGDDAELHARLMNTPGRVTPMYLRDIAEDVGLSWPELEQAMAGPEVTTALHRAKALAQLFAFIGTPALVVGRTVVEGNIPEHRLQELVHHERRDLH